MFNKHSYIQCLYTLTQNGGSDGKESVCNAGDPGLIPGWGGSPGQGNGNPLQFLPGEFHGQRSLAGCSPWGFRVKHN